MKKLKIICANVNRYATYSGTSMATPHVSGVAALIWSLYPTKSAQEVWQAMIQSAKDKGSPGRDNYYGFGIVQAKDAANLLGDVSFTSSPTATPTCVDSPEGWYDSDGPTFNCQWYSTGSNCATYGDSYANQGVTANMACCSCGGGLRSTPSPTTAKNTATPTSSPTTKAPTTKPTPAPTVSPTNSPTASPVETCYDSPSNWYDSDGPTFDCVWYAVGDRCATYGNYYENFGKTANEACCECGGGTTTPPPPGTCLDSPQGWYDSDGPTFDCQWYSVDNRCSLFGDSYANGGVTANMACCDCGGGVTSS
jgi:Subtilisin-like serine proteases